MSFVTQTPQYLYVAYEYFKQNIFDISFFEYNHIYFTDNIEDDYHLFINEKIDCSNTSGLTILPNDIIDEIIVLAKYSNDYTLSNVQTLFHELTHVYDTHMFSNKYFNSAFDNITSHEYYLHFARWSEFKAKAYSELYSYKFFDLLYKTDNTKFIMDSFENKLPEYLQKIQQKVLQKTLSDYAFCEMLGNFYMYDIYKNIDDVSRSCIYLYFSELFDSKLLNQGYNLYSLYFESDKNHQIFEYLKDIKYVDNLIHNHQ